MDKQSIDLIEEGQQADQWAVKQLLSSLRSAEQERDQYKAESIQYANLFQELSVKSANEIASLRAQLKAAQEQEPVLAIQSTTHGKRPSIISQEGFDKLKVGDKLYAHPIPAQQSPAVGVNDVVNRVADFVESQEGGPFTSEVMACAIRGQLKYGDVFKSITPSPRITEQDAREIWAHGYGTGHNDGIGCGHSLAPRCRHSGEKEFYEEDISALLDKLNGEGE